MNNFEEYCTKFVQSVGNKVGIFDRIVKKPLYSRELENSQDIINDFLEADK